MKRFLAVCAAVVLVYACDKETDAVYDTHLFQQLQAHNWILDSARITDSLGRDSLVVANDTADEISRFTSQQYFISYIRKSDSTVLDTAAYQVIYDNPSRMYFYDYVSQQIDRRHYIDIDTVNAESLTLIVTDTLKRVSRNRYHAQ